MNDGGVYYSYLLRMWQVPVSGEDVWRLLLENIQTGEKLGFTTLADLLAYLSQVTSNTLGKPGEGSQKKVQG